MMEFELASASDRNAVIDVSMRRAVPSLDELLDSPLKLACAAFLAVEESWPSADSDRVLGLIDRNLQIDDPSIVAAVAARGAVLDTWWVRTHEDLRAWDRAIGWARVSTNARPDWLLGWLLQVDGHIFRGELDLALAAAEQTLGLEPPQHHDDEFLTAAEDLFGGRTGWNRDQAEELVARVRGIANEK